MRIEIPKAAFDEVEQMLRKIIPKGSINDSTCFYLGVIAGAKMALRVMGLNWVQVDRWCEVLDDLSEL